jgi:hypothetical protein
MAVQRLDEVGAAASSLEEDDESLKSVRRGRHHAALYLLIYAGEELGGSAEAMRPDSLAE